MDNLNQALQLLQILEQDTTVPKNARAKIGGTLKLLQNGNGKVEELTPAEIEVVQKQRETERLAEVEEEQ